ncbi:MAG: restriction endonuclease subunit S [Dysosmobacter sp.]
MARGKKKETLTPEERLQAALVPESEQPYSVPGNWCWVRLGSLLSEIKNGTTIKQDKSGIGFKVTRIESLQNQNIDFGRLGTIVNEQEIKDTDWYLAGDIALSHTNSAEHVGKTALISANMLPLVHGMNLLRLRFYSECCMPLFFQYFSQSFQYKNEILTRINMAVNQVSINQKQISSLEIPLPPICEQQRIVDRIKSLFAKLDEAKQKAQDALDNFETRKAAILHKAFTGKLTTRRKRTQCGDGELEL